MPEPEAAPAKPARQKKSRPAPKPQRRKPAGVSAPADDAVELPEERHEEDEAKGHPDEEPSSEPDAEASARQRR